MAQNKPFDFGSLRRPVKPEPRDSEASTDDQLDQVAEETGFTSREPAVRLERRRSREPLDTAYVRAPLSVINRFKAYCNERGLSYGQALEELMRKAGL